MENNVTPEPAPQRLTRKIEITPPTAGQMAVDVLAAETGLSKSALKDAMSKGAVWIIPKRGNKRRLRRAQTVLHAGDVLALHYDARILKAPVPEARMLRDEGSYGLWYKPPGMLAQGNEYGDHHSLLRVAELWLREARRDQQAMTWLVHRLDREAGGLMLVAYQKKAAAALSDMFQNKRMEKIYWAQVTGKTPAQDVIDSPLDGKPALTRYRHLAWDEYKNLSELEVSIETGRQHQIRRHLEAIGHPLYGDPRYGRNNKNKDGMKLVAWRLGFICPLTKQPRQYDLAELAPDLFSVEKPQ